MGSRATIEMPHQLGPERERGQATRLGHAGGGAGHRDEASSVTDRPVVTHRAGDLYNGYRLEQMIQEDEHAQWWAGRALKTQEPMLLVIAKHAGVSENEFARQTYAGTELIRQAAEDQVHRRRRPKKRRKGRRRGRKKKSTHRQEDSSSFVERFLGAGADGETVVMDSLRPEFRDDEGLLARFHVMGALRAYFRYPNLMPFHSIVDEGPGGWCAIVSSSGQGQYLSQMSATLSPDQVKRIGESVGHVLHYMQGASGDCPEMGFHGNVTSDQIFLRDSGAVLLDGVGLHLFEDWSDAGHERFRRITEALAKAWPAVVDRPPGLQ